MRKALNPPAGLWIDPHDQIWPVKEFMTLLAMIACFVSSVPLCLLLLRLPFFASLRRERKFIYACSTSRYFTYAGINGALMWLYLPLIIHQIMNRYNTLSGLNITIHLDFTVLYRDINPALITQGLVRAQCSIIEHIKFQGGFFNAAGGKKR